MIKAGIIGGAGYTGGELLRLLVNHPGVEISFVHSNSSAGKKLYEVHADLLGETELTFSSEFESGIDVLFLCVGHGDAKKFLVAQGAYVSSLPAHAKVIDLSTDFRHIENAQLTLGDKKLSFVYGLPELNRSTIVGGNHHIANPGCFATCIQLGLLPLAKAGLLKADVHAHAVTGSTGAGQKPVETTHFSWRANNLSVYKAFEHQHLKEITESLSSLQPDFEGSIHFVPLRGDFTRGIFATQYVETPISLEEARSLYSAYYESHPFAHLVTSNPDMKQVVNTNKCFIHLEKHGSKLMILSMIDNLLKGASGQAVQNMNLLFGLPEDQGLRLKSIAF